VQSDSLFDVQVDALNNTDPTPLPAKTTPVPKKNTTPKP